MKWSKYNYILSSKKFGKLLYNSSSGAFLKFDNSVDIENFKKNPDLIDRFYNKKELVKYGILVNDDEDIINKKRLKTTLERINNKSLSLTIVPTQACNFNCNYCFEIDRQNNYMTDEIEDNLINFIKNHQDIQSIHITWYGGEPLLAIDRIVSITNKIKALNIKYSANIVTNGYLLEDAIIEKLIEAQISIMQITLDGIKDIHDSRRKLLSGKGTFDTIIKNLKNIYEKKININISIRVNIDKKNKHNYIELLNYFEEIFPKHNFSVYPAFVESYGDNCKPSECLFDNISRGEFLKELYQQSGICSSHFFPRPSVSSCMARSINSYLVAPNGDLYKCWSAIGSQDMVVGNINSKVFHSTILSRFLKGADFLEDMRCNSCFYFPACDGGCSFLRLQEKYMNKKVNYCMVAKGNLPEFLEMHYESKIQK